MLPGWMLGDGEYAGATWAALPRGVQLWTVRGIALVERFGSVSLDAMPPLDRIDHDGTYVIDLERTPVEGDDL